MHSKLAFWIVGTNFQSSYVEPDEVVSQIGKPSCLSGTTNWTIFTVCSTPKLPNLPVLQPSSFSAQHSSASSGTASWSFVPRLIMVQFCGSWNIGFSKTSRTSFEHFPRLRVFETCDPESSPMPGTSSMWGQSCRYIRKNTFLLTIQQLSHIVLDFQEMDFCDSGSGDGCARSFPNKLSPGLCAKCTKLATFTEGSAEYEQWKVCHPSRPFHVNVDFYFFH